MGGGPEKLVTLEEAARLLKVPADDVEQMIREGRLPSFRLGGNLLRLRLCDVEALAQARAGKGKPARPGTGSGLLDRVRDFFYFNDFYLIAFLLLLTLLAVIFSL